MWIKLKIKSTLFAEHYMIKLSLALGHTLLKPRVMWLIWKRSVPLINCGDMESWSFLLLIVWLFFCFFIVLTSSSGVVPGWKNRHSHFYRSRRPPQMTFIDTKCLQQSHPLNEQTLTPHVTYSGFSYSFILWEVVGTRRDFLRKVYLLLFTKTCSSFLSKQHQYE